MLEVQEPADQVKVPSVTCVEREECSLQLESGEDGTEEPTSDKEDMPSLPLWLLQLSSHWFKPEDTELMPSQNSHWLSKTQLRKSKEPEKPLDS